MERNGFVRRGARITLYICQLDSGRCQCSLCNTENKIGAENKYGAKKLKKYILLHLVRPSTEELLLGVFKIRLLFQNGMRSSE